MKVYTLERFVFQSSYLTRNEGLLHRNDQPMNNISEKNRFPLWEMYYAYRVHIMCG